MSINTTKNHSRGLHPQKSNEYFPLVFLHFQELFKQRQFPSTTFGKYPWKRRELPLSHRSRYFKNALLDQYSMSTWINALSYNGLNWRISTSCLTIQNFPDKSGSIAQHSDKSTINYFELFDMLQSGNQFDTCTTSIVYAKISNILQVLEKQSSRKGFLAVPCIRVFFRLCWDCLPTSIWRRIPMIFQTPKLIWRY